MEGAESRSQLPAEGARRPKSREPDPETEREPNAKKGTNTKMARRMSPNGPELTEIPSVAEVVSAPAAHALPAMAPDAIGVAPLPEKSAVPAPGDAELYVQSLRHIGFTDHEARMYYALAARGPSTATQAIQNSQLDRATGYRMLSRLRARGLVTVKGFRPQRFVALEPPRLFDRVLDLVRDDLELRRVVREVSIRAMTGPREANGNGNGGPVASPVVPTVSVATEFSVTPTVPTIPPRVPQCRLLPGPETIGPELLSLIGTAKKEVCALVHPRTLTPNLRKDLAQSFVAALKRGVVVRMVFDYRPAELEFLTAILREYPGAMNSLVARFYAPQWSRLMLGDQRIALRCLSPPGYADLDPDLGIVSEDPALVRSQVSRFENVWRASIPIEQALASSRGSVMTPPTCSREIRQAIDTLNRNAPRDPFAGAYRATGFGGPPRVA
jgi:sugar-specific transcriptional regulator TrmB